MSHDSSVEQQILATIDKWVEQELRPIAREQFCLRGVGVAALAAHQGEVPVPDASDRG